VTLVCYICPYASSSVFLISLICQFYHSINDCSLEPIQTTLGYSRRGALTVFDILSLFAQVVIGVGLLYHYALLIAGGKPRCSTDDTDSKDLRFAITIPAHNEQSVVGATVARIRQMNYDPEKFDVHIVADHCSDTTAQVARAAGALAHERSEGPRGRKGYALAWLLTRLLSSSKEYDAFVVFDADSQVDPDFLSVMNLALSTGAQVVQGRHVIANPSVSVFSALADADMRLNNRIRNQAKENLGLSARLMGDGMCFRREILELYPFGAHSLVEDREYGIYLVIHDVHVRFAHEAISVGQAVVRWNDATVQRLRWYGGVFDLQKRYLGPLLTAAWRNRNLAALDLALEMSLPSFSTLAVLAVSLIAFQLIFGFTKDLTSVLPSLLLVLLVFTFPFLGLLLEKAPKHNYKALIYGPAYVVWRVWLGLKVRLQRGQVPWIRTRRAEEEKDLK
jgi:cellulose synthase/poly-beta-1,6-N-acetylglucosamine synthase-like glycosyltransferase